MDEQKELKPCPFCGGSGVENFCCGAAIPDCPRCSPLFGCGSCDVWLDSVEEWNTRAASELSALRAELEQLKLHATKAKKAIESAMILSTRLSQWAEISKAHSELTQAVSKHDQPA